MNEGGSPFPATRASAVPTARARARDELHMRRALQLARRGRGRVEPNPMVGCVLVKRGRVIGEGYHRRFGGQHAEIEALRQAGAHAVGATCYVTLEPCCYHGKTPPCTEALIAEGVTRVCAAIRDPHSRVAGQGLAQLHEAGVEVEAGLMADEATALAAPFTKLMSTGHPWVILKWAQSLDGKIATHTGDAKWISDERMRAHAHRVRSRLDGIVVGVNTVLTDDPLLTCRVGKVRRRATRIVLDSRLRTPVESQLVQSAGESPTLIFCAEGAAVRRRKRLEAAGCTVFAVPCDADGNGLDLDAVLNELGRLQMTNVLVEGGGRVLGRFLDAGLADEAHVYLMPMLIGGEQATSAFAGRGVKTVAEAVRFDGDSRPRRLGSGYLWQARLAK